MTEDGGSDRDALEGLTRPDSRILLAPPPRSSPDDIFGSFVQNANTAWVASVEAALAEMDAEPDPTEHDAAEHDAAEHDASVAAPAPLDGPGSDRDPQGTDRVVMLTRRRFSSRSEDLGEVESDAHIQHLDNDEASVGDEAEAVTVRVPLPGSPETPARRRGRPARDTTAPIEPPRPGSGPRENSIRHPPEARSGEARPRRRPRASRGRSDPRVERRRPDAER